MKQCQNFACDTAILGSASSDQTDYINDASVDLVVTSPPFLDVVQYAEDNWVRCWFTGIDAKTVPISMHKTVKKWTDFTTQTLKELSRVVKPGGHIAYEVGEVRNGKILLEQYVAKAARNLPLEVLGIMVNEQNFTKTANCWGVKNNSKGTNSNHIVVMKRRQMTKHTAQSLETIVKVIRQHDTHGISYPAVIEAFAGQKVIEVNKTTDRLLIKSLQSAMNDCENFIANNSIQSSRINEVGNKMEQLVIDAINKMNGSLSAEKPKTRSGRIKSTGYPDVLIWDGKKPTYLEIKTYNKNSLDTTLRSFYLSPSTDFKIVHDARHMLVGFEIEETTNNLHVANSHKLIDLFKLPCAVQFEINSNNKLMYRECENLV